MTDRCSWLKHIPLARMVLAQLNIGMVILNLAKDTCVLLRFKRPYENIKYNSKCFVASLIKDV